MTQIPRNFGERVRYARALWQLSAEQFASDLGVSFSTVKNWERGRAMPNKALLRVVARYFRVSTDWLLDGDGDGPPPHRTPDSAVLIGELDQAVRWEGRDDQETAQLLRKLAQRLGRPPRP